MAATGRFNAQNARTLACSASLPRYCFIPGAWPPGSSSASKSDGSSVFHDTGLMELGRAGELVVEALGLGLGAELAEEHAGQQQRISAAG